MADLFLIDLFLAPECIQYRQLFNESILIFYIFHRFKNSKVPFYHLILNKFTYPNISKIISAHGYLDNGGFTVLLSGS